MHGRKGLEPGPITQIKWHRAVRRTNTRVFRIRVLSSPRYTAGLNRTARLAAIKRLVLRTGQVARDRYGTERFSSDAFHGMVFVIQCVICSA
jgi:hypothetical protein